jgi:hypothetical protein
MKMGKGRNSEKRQDFCNLMRKKFLYLQKKAYGKFFCEGHKCLVEVQKKP